MQDRLLRPDALVEVKAVLRKATGVDGATHRELVRPVRLAEIVDANPKKIAAHVIVSLDELLLLLDLDEIIGRHFEKLIDRLLDKVDPRAPRNAELSVPIKRRCG
jgi:hypothetical protein